jgi:hypothetical protein
MTPTEEQREEAPKEGETGPEPSSLSDDDEPQKWIRRPFSTEQFTIEYETKIKVLLEEFLDGLFDNYMLWMSIACFRMNERLHEIPYVHVAISPDADIEGLEFPPEIGEAGFGLVLGRMAFGGGTTLRSENQGRKNESTHDESNDESSAEESASESSLSGSDFPAVEWI